MSIEDKKRLKMMRSIAKRKVELFTQHHLSTTGRAMSFINYPYLMKIYRDSSPLVCIMSSVQTGKSEESLIHAMASLEAGLSVFHVFSTSMAKNAFVKSRVEELCDKVPYYQQMEKDTLRNHYLKSMGNGRWKFAISSARNNFDEFPADLVIIDELDSCDQENVKLADSRMENSPYKFKRIIGNPTVKNRGTSEIFDKSCMYEWHFQCNECGEYFPSDFFKCVVDEILDEDANHLRYELYDKEWTKNCGRDIYVRCTHCGKLQDRNKWKKESDTKVKYGGAWIAESPENEWSGYHVSQVMKLNSKLSDLWESLLDAEGNDFKLQVFYNKLLGLPYEGVGSKITMEMLNNCAVGYSEFKAGQSHGRAVAGIDVGRYYDMQIDLPIREKKGLKKRRMLLHVCRCESLDEVRDKIDQYNIGTVYIDAAPEYNAISRFQEEMSSRCDVWRVQISRGKSGSLKLDGYKVDEEDGCITVDRDWFLEEGMRAVNEKIDLIPEGFESLLNGFWAESLCSITREFVQDEGLFHWSKADGKDHFRFAHAFSFLAFRDNTDPVLIDDMGLVIGLKREEEETPEEKERAKRMRDILKPDSPLKAEQGILRKPRGLRGKRTRRGRF